MIVSSAPASRWTGLGKIRLRFLVLGVLGAALAPRCSQAQSVEQQQGPITVAYRMPADGQLTLGLYDGQGRLLRWLIQDDFRYAGENRQSWDGLDQWGRPVPPGKYALRAAYHPPLSAEYRMTVCNPGNPPWPTADDKGDWLGDEAPPQAVVSDGKWVFLGSPGAEIGFSVIALDETGQRQWGHREPFNPRSIALALDGDYLYLLYGGPEATDSHEVYNGHNAIGRAVLVCLDKRTGKPARFARQTPRLRVATWPYREEISWMWDLRNHRSFRPGNNGGQPRYSRTDVAESSDALGLAAAGGKLYVSMFYENKLIALDAETGHPTGEEIPLEAPVGLCALDAHSLLAVSGTRVVKLDLAQGSRHTPCAAADGTRRVPTTDRATLANARVLIASGLVAPHSVAVDKQGTIFVSDWGTSFQVKAFAPDGRFLRAIGKEGGRPWVGAWDRDGMLVPRGIAVTDDGKLWVAEEDNSPKRISVWNSGTGAFVRDYLGPTPYGGGTHFWIDPRDPSRVNAAGARFRIDEARKTYTPEAITYRRRSRDDPFTPNGHELIPATQVRILYRNGKEYGVFKQSDFLTIMQRQGDVYQSVAAIGNVHRDPNQELNGNGTETFLRDDMGHHVYRDFFPECFRGHLGDNYSWTDANADGLVQPEEMHWVKTSDAPYREGAQARFNNYWGIDVSPDWSVFFPGRYRDHWAVFRLDVSGWTAAGAPVYDMARARPILLDAPDHAINGLHVTADKKLIVVYDYEWGHSPDSIACHDLEGRRLWSIAMPSRLKGNAVHANNAVYDLAVPGLGDVVCTWLYHGSQRPYLIASDGLYLGTLLDDVNLAGPAALWGESSKYFYQAPDGTPSIINGGNQQLHLLRIKGLEPGRVGRVEDVCRLTGDDVRRAAKQRALPVPKAPPKPLLAVTWLSRTPTIDGDLSDWNLDRGVSLRAGDGRAAEVALGRDARYLYLAYKIHEPKPLRNGGADWQTLFASGDCADLTLATDPAADPHRRAAAPGDLRLLLSVFQGQPIAVLYRPVVPGTGSPVSISTARIDRVVRLDSAKISLRRDAAQGLATLEAAIPLADLGIDAKRTADLYGDVGVIFADQSGRSRSLRLYYYNRHTEMVSDVPTEATLQPSQWGTLLLPLGPNLLHYGGFEEPLVESRAEAVKGWFITGAKNGSRAVLSSESPYSGHRSLLLETPVPMTIPPEAYQAADYEVFRRSVNGGRGGASVELLQTVPVIAGHRYSLRYRYRCDDFQPERKQPGHPRGYVAFHGRIEWHCAGPQRAARDTVASVYETTPDWQTVVDFRGWDMSRPYTAPEGATAATVVFVLNTLAEGRLPKLFLDDVELVDASSSGSP